MKQVWIPKIGTPDVLKVQEAEDPTPGDGEVRIRANFSGINFADVMARMGLYPDAPKIPTVVGYEVSGVVDAVGAGVTKVKAGDRVLALTRFGGYSDTVVVPENQVSAISEKTPFDKAAAIPVTYLTAYMMLVRLGNVRKGDKVLIHAAAGGVGLAALQICRWKGAETFGTASGPKHERLKQHGLDHAIDYRNQDFKAEILRLTNGRGVDIALDAVGGESLKKSYDCLAPLGRVFTFGASSFGQGTSRSLVDVAKGLWHTPSFKPFDLMDKNRGILGVNLGHLWEEADMLGELLGEIIEQVEAGNFDPVVDAVFPFSKAADAHAYIQNRKNFGKVLLQPD